MGGRVRQKVSNAEKGLKYPIRSQMLNEVEVLSCFWPKRKFDTFTRYWDLNGILTFTRFDILTSFWGPFQHLTPLSFIIWDLIGYLRLFAAFDTLLADIRDLICYLRPFSAFDTLFIQHLTLFRYMRPFSAFETLFIQHLRPYWLFETLFSISHPLYVYNVFRCVWGGGCRYLCILGKKC